MNVPRERHFRFSVKNRVLLVVFEGDGDGLCARAEPAESFQFPERWKSKPRFPAGRVSSPSSPSAYQSLYFPFFSRIRSRVHQRSETENRLDVSSAEFAKGDGTQFPQESRRCVYTSSRERRKYCVATNRNMYRVLSAERSLSLSFRHADIFLSLSLSLLTSLLIEWREKNSEWFVKIRESTSPSSFIDFSPKNPNSVNSISKGVARKYTPEWFIYVFLICYFSENLERFIPSRAFAYSQLWLLSHIFVIFIFFIFEMRIRYTHKSAHTILSKNTIDQETQ